MDSLTTFYHHGFAGGSKNTSRLLHNLSLFGWDVEAYVFEKPQFFEYTISNVQIKYLNKVVNSDVIASPIIDYYGAVEQAVEDMKKTETSFLFGSNLFPYACMALDLKCQLKATVNNKQKLLLFVVGSDAWQIGPQVKSRVKWLLDNSLVDNVLTFSNSFAEEIRTYYGIKRQIKILPPILDGETFFPLQQERAAHRRQSLGLTSSHFIIHHHSSMRRIKSPELVLEVAVKAAQSTRRDCVLIMSGPIPQDIIQLMDLELIPSKRGRIAYESQVGMLTILWTGLVSDVTYLMQIADVEVNFSLHDSFNMALMEAMACAVPVVTTSVVGIKEHIVACEAGYCVPTQRLCYDKLNEVLNNRSQKRQQVNIDEAVHALVSMSENDNERELMGKRGAAYVSETFNPGKVINLFNLIAHENV